MPRKPKVEKAKGVFEKVKGSGIWWIRWTDSEGVRRAESVGRFGDAKDRHALRKSESKQGILTKSTRNTGRRGYPAHDAVLLSALIDDAITFSKRNHKDFPNFIRKAEVWRESFGDRAADSLKPVDISDWLEDMAEQWEWAPATCNRYKAVISKVYTLALQYSHVSTNPSRFVPLKKEPRGRIRFITEDEESRLRAVILKWYPSYMPQFVLALNTGMRKGEQFSLEWSQFDPNLSMLYLSMTKNGSDRYVHLNADALSALESLGNKKEGRVFEIKNPRRWFEETCKEAKVFGVSWHTLRHTFASRLVMKDVNLRTVQDLMGHKNINMTVRYSHLAPSHLQAAVATLVANPKPPTTQQSSTEEAA